MKFGGGCLRDGRSVAQACAIISARQRTAVVVSAVSGVTELLLAAIGQARRHERHIPPVLEALEGKHLAIAGELCPSGAAQGRLRAAIASRVAQVGRLLFGVACHGDLTLTVRARLLSQGERLAAQLLAGVLESMDLPAAALDARSAGVCTDGNVLAASVDRGRTRRLLGPRLAALLRRGIVPVIPGFYGRGPDNGVTLLGRNGSDYSAAAVAFALGAERLEVWKDADGFMSADPARVPTARRLERLTFAEAAELSYFGAKVLHPRTVEPLAGTRTRVFVRSVNDPSGAGSEIAASCPNRAADVAGIAANERLSVLRVHGAGIGSKPGLLAGVSSSLAEAGINIHSVLTSHTCISLLLDPADAARGLRQLKSRINGVIKRIEPEEHLALVGVVGERIMQKEGIYARIFSAVARERINVEMAAAGASPVACYFLVRKAELDRALRAVHDEFFP
jgi:aspartate kinase